MDFFHTWQQWLQASADVSRVMSVILVLYCQRQSVMTWPSSGGIVFICDRWSLPWKGVPRNMGLLPDTLNYGLCIHHNSQANWAMMCHITHCNSTSASKRKGHQSPVGWHQLTSRCGHVLNNLTSRDLKAPLVIWRDPWIFDAEICVALIW